MQLFSVGGIIAHIFDLDDLEDETTKEEVQIGIGYSYLYIIVNVLLIYGACKVRYCSYYIKYWIIEIYWISFVWCKLAISQLVESKISFSLAISS